MPLRTCPAKIRPFPNDTEIRCELEEGTHVMHRAALRGYAYAGSLTVISWMDGDRRGFEGDWPGACPECESPNLPLGHKGRHTRAGA